MILTFLIVWFIVSPLVAVAVGKFIKAGSGE